MNPSPFVFNVDTFIMFNLKTIRFAPLVVFAILATTPLIRAAEIQIKQTASVQSEMIRLSDIAEIRSTAPDAKEKLSAIEIGPAPKKGTKQLFDYKTIRSRLLANGVNLANLRVTGQRVVTVSRPEDAPQRKSQTKKAEVRAVTATSRERQQANRLLEPVLQSYLEEHAPKLGNVSLNIGLPSEVAREFSKVLPKSIVVLGVSSLDKNRYRFRVSGTQFNRNPIEALLVVEVQSWPFVLAANTSLARGHVVTTADLSWVQQEETAGSLTRLDQVVGREVVRSVRKDQPLDNKDLRNTPLIRRNDKVTVYVRTATFTAQKLFRAREDGALGETIELANERGKVITAKVTAYHEAEIVLGAPPVRTKGDQKLSLASPIDARSLPRPQLSRIPERPFRATNESRPRQPENWDHHSAGQARRTDSVSTVGYERPQESRKGVAWSNGAAKRNQ